jgi:translocation and assembly module TamB
LTAPEPQIPAEAVRERTALPKAIVAVCLVVLLLIAGLLATTRYGVLLPQARLLLEARASGLKIGRFGRLKIEGLQGDVWRDLTVRRLTITDEKGVWLEADNVHLVWRYAELFSRRFHADQIAFQELHVLRRPTLTPKGKDNGLPVSFHIDDLHGRLEMLPAFSYRRGVYDVKAALDIERSGRQSGQVAAASALHPGDHLDVKFDLGKGRPILVDAVADEARGGALAGALGLPVDQPFSLRAHAEGTTSKGRFTAVTGVGNSQPLRASGDWTPQGGAASGRLELGASRLTAGLAGRLGPEVIFAVAGRKATPGLFALDARATAANLAVTARGLGDLGQRRSGPQGLALTMAAADLSKVAGGPAKGPANLQGTWTGDAANWRFSGAGSAARVSLGGYSLERLSGPLVLESKGKALTLTTTLAGQGGAGAGWVAAMLGGKPQAKLVGSRLADGRLLVRELDVAGPGLKVQASGDRSLLGGLDFQGKAEVFNIGSAAKGAAGSVSGTWSAVQSGANKPWAFGVDAKAARFATGLAELDRLLGAEPRLIGKASVEGGKVSITEATLTGGQAEVKTAGVLGPAGALSLKLDWTANGPFRAGPVEISGKAKGSGALTGTLAAPRADLLADFDEIDVPGAPLKNAHLTLSFVHEADGSSGLVTLAADSAYGAASAKSAFRFPEGGVDLTDLAVNVAGIKAAGSLALRARTPSAADLTLSIGRGALLDGGQVSGAVKIVDAPGGARASLDLTAANAVLPGAVASLRNGRVTANGPLARLPYQAKLGGALPSGPWSLDGQGLLTTEPAGYALTFDGSGQAGGRALRTAEPTLLRFGGATQSARLRLAAADGGHIDIDAALAEGSADIRAQVTKLGLSVLNEDLAGQADATLTLQGHGGALSGTLDAKLQAARARGADVATGVDGTLKARIADNAIILDGEAANGQGLKAKANIVLPAETSASPFRIAIARTRPMRGTFFADGEVKPLWDLLVGGQRNLSGHVRMEGVLGGTLADPAATGTAALDGGAFHDGATGLDLRDVVLKSSFTRAAIDVTQATGGDGHNGTISGAGRISLAPDGVSSFKLDLKGFRLIDNEQATASATGQTTIDRDAAGKVRLSGALSIDRADVAAKPPTPTGIVVLDVVERNRPADLDHALESTAAKPNSGWAMDVTLKAPRRVFLRGRGLDMELSLDAHVGGTTARPQLTGVARVVRGDYDFAGKRFVFDTHGVVYLSTRPEEIRLDLTATRDDPALTAAVQIRGTAAKPEITLTSTPVLPTDEVLSQVLFGTSAAQLSPLEAAQLASALSALSGNGGFDVVGNLRSFARLDRLALGGDQTTGTTISGGKYLTDSVYLEITGGGREGPSAQVEWRVTKGLSLLSRLAGQRDAKLAVRWRHDY